MGQEFAKRCDMPRHAATRHMHVDGAGGLPNPTVGGLGVLPQEIFLQIYALRRAFRVLLKALGKKEKRLKKKKLFTEIGQKWFCLPQKGLKRFEMFVTGSHNQSAVLLIIDPHYRHLLTVQLNYPPRS